MHSLKYLASLSRPQRPADSTETERAKPVFDQVVCRQLRNGPVVHLNQRDPGVENIAQEIDHRQPHFGELPGELSVTDSCDHAVAMPVLEPLREDGLDMTGLIVDRPVADLANILGDSSQHLSSAAVRAFDDQRDAPPGRLRGSFLGGHWMASFERRDQPGQPGKQRCRAFHGQWPLPCGRGIGQRRVAESLQTKAENFLDSNGALSVKSNAVSLLSVEPSNAVQMVKTGQCSRERP